MPLRRHLSPLLLVSALVGCSGALGGENGPPPPAFVSADGVTLERIALYQGLERDLMKDGAVGTLGANIPVVAGRDATVRVFYSTDAAYDKNPVVARLTFVTTQDPVAGSGGGTSGAPPEPTETTVELSATLIAASAQDDLTSTLNFEVPGALIAPSTSFRVEILRAREQSTGANTKATYPSTGAQPLQAVSVGAKVKLVLVPIRYQSDGSGRLPDTSPEQVKLYHDVFLKQFPVPEVDIRVAEPFDWKGIAVLGTGQGWGELLNALGTHRQKAGAAFDEYYYGLFRAQDTFEQFCGGACIAGLSQLATSPLNEQARVGIGLGFSGEGVAVTAIHEVGHEHGRGHVPCGTNQGLDPGYPHNDGAIGGYGFDMFTKQLVKPTTKDFMSYCDPKWISDFTFNALLTRIQAVNGTMMEWVTLPGHDGKQRYERLAFLPNGTTEWLDPFELERSPVGVAEPIHLEGSAGARDVVGQFFPYSHLPGGVVYFPSTGRVDRVRARNRVISR